MRSVLVGMMLAAAAPAGAADYVVVTLHADINAPADAAWSKVGGYCDIGKWAKLPCEMVSGTGGVGSVRKLAGGVIEEPMFAATAHSYTYGQTVGPNKGIDYHGTLAVEPTGARSSRATYTLIYDQALVPPDKRDAMKSGLQRFQRFLDTMKEMAEAPGQ